jgi:hypothetical protein
MPARWLMDLCDGISGNRGYLAVGSVLAAYLAAFGLVDTKSTQEETHTALERSLFITLVSAGNAASFVAAMKDFGPIQTMPVTDHPSLLRFWEWRQTYQPNLVPMWHWAVSGLRACGQNGAKDCSLNGDTRLDLSGANLHGAYLFYVNLSGANLRLANLHGATLALANLRDADLRDADLSDANLGWATLAGAKYSDKTIFPSNFDPKAQGMVLTAN